MIRVGGGPGGGLGSEDVVRGGLAVWVCGSVLVFMSGSDSAVPSPAAGVGSGGGLVGGVPGGQGAILAQEEVVSMV